MQLTAVPTLDDLGIAPAQPPQVTKVFASHSIVVGSGGATTMTFTVTNTNTTIDLLNVKLTDTLPTPLQIPSPSGATGTCLALNGAALVLNPVSPPSTAFTLTIPTLSANTSCTLTLNVALTAATTGTPACTVTPPPSGLGISPEQNTANVTSDNAGPGAPGIDCIGYSPIRPPEITKNFSPTSTQKNTCVAMNFTISNPNTSSILTNVHFTDTLPAGLTVCSSPVPSGTCLTGFSGVFTPTPPTPYAEFKLNIPTFGPTSTCTFSIPVQASTDTSFPNSVTVISDQLTGNTSSDTLIVNTPPQPPTITKHFSPNPVNQNQVSQLTFTLGNPNSINLSGIAFSDPLPGTVKIQTPNGLLNNCGGTVTATAGTQTITVSGVHLGPNGLCTIKVDVISADPGSFPNTTTAVTSADPVLAGNTASDTLVVLPPPQPRPDCTYQVNYAANLNIGDSFVNLTNFGTLSGADPSGNICVNVYVFDPAEEPVSCCACPVTPNGLRSLSVQRDLISNALTRGVPTSVVIKLVATVPINGTCDPASPVSNANTTNLVRGMGAWRTTLHALPTSPVTYQPTENEFECSYLSDTELQKLSYVCGFMQTYGSGYGICKSCRDGALGANAAP